MHMHVIKNGPLLCTFASKTSTVFFVLCLAAPIRVASSVRLPGFDLSFGEMRDLWN